MVAARRDGYCSVCGSPITVFKTLKGHRVYDASCDPCRQGWRAAAVGRVIPSWNIPCIGYEEPKMEKPLHSGLRRDLKFDDRMRTIIAKFETGGKLTQIEFRYLLLFYGMLVRMAEIVGQPYDLLARDVNDKHHRLIALAPDLGFNQGLLSMYGGIVEDLFGRFV